MWVGQYYQVPDLKTVKNKDPLTASVQKHLKPQTSPSVPPAVQAPNAPLLPVKLAVPATRLQPMYSVPQPRGHKK